MYLKHCMVTSNVEYFKGDVQEIIKSHKTIKQWAYILHDKDDTKPHYHIYLNFGSSGVETKQIGEWFGLQESQVEKLKGRKWNALEYLTHSDNKQKYKHQYSPTEVIANFDFETEINKNKIVGDFDNFSYAQQLEYVNALPISEKRAAFTMLEKLWKIQCQWLMLHPDRKIEVMFIHGKGGTGKTYYAKKLLKSMEKDFCVSSSSNDTLQDYMGQAAIILDDLRDTTFKFEDLLKFLDNDTRSTVQSRFNNKCFNGDLIVITSTVPLSHWYRELWYNKDDTLSQLYRRITCYVRVTEQYVEVYDELNEKGHPAGLPRVFKNEVATLKRAKTKKTDFAAAFGKIAEDAAPEIIEEYKKKLTNRSGG